MQRIFSTPVAKPSSWQPPFVEGGLEESEVPLQFRLIKDPEGDAYRYFCCGCLSAGGDRNDMFCTSSAEEDEWPYGDIGVPRRLAFEMLSHARQHEILWRWSVNRIPSPEYDK